MKVRINKYRSLIQALSLSLSFEQGRAIPYHRPMNIYICVLGECMCENGSERERNKETACHHLLNQCKPILEEQAGSYRIYGLIAH